MFWELPVLFCKPIETTPYVLVVRFTRKQRQLLLIGVVAFCMKPSDVLALFSVQLL